MASWLKAAEDLFEVVDRRAKLVVSELADEETESKTPASIGQGTQGKKVKSRPKAHKLQVTNASPISSDVTQDKSGSRTELLDEKPGKDKDTHKNEVHGTDTKASAANSEQKSSANNPSPLLGKPLSELPVNDVNKQDIDHLEIRETDSGVQAVSSSENGEENDKNALGINKEVNHESKKVYEVSNEDTPLNTENINKSGEGDSVLKIDQQKSSESRTADSMSNGEPQLKDVSLKAEPISNQKNEQEREATNDPTKLQDPLDEAQGLLKTANATGKSKEARLARVCAGLSSRLQEFKSENAQLEELLVAERELSKSYEARIKQLEEYLYESKNEVSKVESSMVEALAAKNSEIEAILNSMDSLKKQAAASEGNLASLQANMDSIMRNRELTETRMMQALREELASAERRAEEERAAHNATKMAAMEREVELEQRAVEASTALARTQRVADERTTRAAELEQKIALLEVECASLNQELQDMEVRVRRGQKKSPDEVNQMLQMQAWQEEVERARQGQRDAESKLSSLEAEMQKMRVEMAALKRDAEHYSQQEHVELEKRYRELTDLLYYKQTQLETMASEKAAAEFQLEKEIRHLQEAKVEAERNRASRRGSSTWEDDTEIKALEPLPLHHRHIAGASIQLQKAAKLLDSGAVRATKFLWRHPIARVFVHLFLMYLLHRLQEQADDFAGRELAEAMGLSNRTLP